MPVFKSTRSVLLAAAVALALPAGSAHAEPLTMKRFEKAMEEVFSGKIFEAAAKQVRQAHKKYVRDPVRSNKSWPFYIPDQNQKPVKIVPRTVRSTPAIQKPKAKPVIASAKVRNTQAALNTLGYDAGVADGVYGRRTAKAVERYQDTIGETVTGSLTEEQRTLLLRSARQKRQIAAVQPKRRTVPARAHTVVVKQPGTIVEPKTNTAAKGAQEVVAAKPAPPVTVIDDGAKATLPENSDSNPFDADDPDDELLPTQ